MHINKGIIIVESVQLDGIFGGSFFSSLKFSKRGSREKAVEFTFGRIRTEFGL